MHTKIKQWIAACLCMMLLTAALSPAAVTVQAAESSGSSTTIAVDGSWVDSTLDDDIGYYYFTLTSGGRVEFTVQSYTSDDGRLALYDQALSNEYTYTTYYGGSQEGPVTKSFTRDLEAGTYCLKAGGYGYFSDSSTWTGSLRLKVSFTPAGNNETEPNDSFETAMLLSGSNASVTGFLSETDIYDFYQFNVTKAGNVTVTYDFSNSDSSPEISVWDKDLVQLKRNTYSRNGDISLECEPGTYYIKAYTGTTNSSSIYRYTGAYTLGYAFEDAAKLNFDTTEITASASGVLSKSSVAVDSGGKEFTVSTYDSWLKAGTSSSDMSSKVTFSGSGTVYLSAEKNTGSRERTGKFTLTHADGKLKKEIIVKQEKAELEVNTAEITASASGTLSRPYITVNSDGAEFTAESDKSWLKVGTSSVGSAASSKVSFSGNGNVYIFAEKNTTFDSRTATITLTHANGSKREKITVRQDKAEAVMEADTTDITVSASGTPSRASFTVSTNGAKFTVQTDNSWLKVGTSASSVASTYLSFDGNGSVYIFINKNTSNDPRTGTITLKHSSGTLEKTITVKQNAADAVLDVEDTQLTASASGKLSKSYISVDSNQIDFMAKSDSSWLTVSMYSYETEGQMQESFRGNSSVYVYAAPNTSSESRTGTITLTHNNGTLTKVITVKQEGLTQILIVDVSEKTVNRLGEFYDSEVSVKTQNTGGFTVETGDSDWLKIASSSTSDITDGLSRMTFEDDHSFYLVAAENTGSERTATVTITHALNGVSKTITVTQKGTEGAYLQVDRETAYFDEPDAAVSGMVQISANEDIRWTVNTSENWIKLADWDSVYASTVVTMEGTGNSSFYIYVDANGTYEERSGYVTISAPGMETLEIYVSQAENERDLGSLLEETTVSVNKKTFKIGKTSKVKFGFPEGLYASDVAKVTYSSSKKKVATVNKKGVITAKRKGKAVIRVEVTLDNGVYKVFNLKVTVGKRKVTVTKK